jgi:hypothetical protein
MRWYEAKTLEDFNALSIKERIKMPWYLECRRSAARSLYDPFKAKKLKHLLDQREHEAVNVSANSPTNGSKRFN